MTSAGTWRDAEPEQFAAALLAAAEQLGVLPLAVEKDYWVCQALRAITTAHAGEVVFKGGTSLEKLRIIRRFSEDLDLLVVGDYASNRAVERALKSMVQVDGPSRGVSVAQPAERRKKRRTAGKFPSQRLPLPGTPPPGVSHAACRTRNVELIPNGA